MNLANLQRQNAALVARVDELMREVRDLRRQMDAAPPGFPVPAISRLVHAAAAEFGVSVGAILSPRRDAAFVEARQVVMYLAVAHLGRSLPTIGRCLQRDHTTVLYAHRRIAARIAAEPDLAARVARVAAIADTPALETAA